MTLFTLGIVMPFLVYCMIMLVRNEAVFRYRTRLIQAKYLAARARIEATPPDDWEAQAELSRYLLALSQALDSVEYDTMVRRFWVPLPAFYAGTILESEGLTRPYRPRWGARHADTP